MPAASRQPAPISLGQPASRCWRSDPAAAAPAGGVGSFVPGPYPVGPSTPTRPRPMTHDQDRTPAPPAALLVVGNTRARTASYADGAVHHSAAHGAGDAAAIAQALAPFLEDHHGAPVLVASVNQPAAQAAAKALREHA